MTGAILAWLLNAWLTVKPHLPIINTVWNIFFTVVLLPFMRNTFGWRRELKMLQKKQYEDNTQVIFFGIVGGRLQPVVVGSFVTLAFKKQAQYQIARWNHGPSPDLITFPDPVLNAHVQYVLHDQVNLGMLKAADLAPYLKDAPVVDENGFIHWELVVVPVRPDADKLNLHDSPRVAVIEESALRFCVGGEVLVDDTDCTQPTFRDMLKYVGEQYVAGNRVTMVRFKLAVPWFVRCPPVVSEP